MNWSAWLDVNWGALVRGENLAAPPWLASLAESRFRSQAFAFPNGQRQDWTLSISDGSRIHVHEYHDGRRVVHRDKFDPDQGIHKLIAHLIIETPLVPATAIAVLLLGLLNRT